MQLKLTEKSPLLFMNKKKKYGSDIQMMIKSSFFDIPFELLVHMIKFLSIEDLDSFSRTSKEFYNLNQELLNIRTLYKMVRDIHQDNFTMITRSRIFLGIILELILLSMGTYCVNAIVKLNNKRHREFSFDFGSIIYIGLLGQCLIGAMICFSVAICLPWMCSSDEVRPSQAIGNLRKMILAYNDLFPNNKLGIDPSSDGAMTGEQYKQHFQLGIKLIRYSVNHNLAPRIFRDSKTSYFFPPMVKKPTIDLDAAAENPLRV